MLMENSNKLDVLEFKYVFCFVVKEEGYFCVVSFKEFFFKSFRVLRNELWFDGDFC